MIKGKRDYRWQMMDDREEKAGSEQQPETNNLKPSTINGQQSSKKKTIWLEDESQRIGLVNIPIPLWKTIRHKPVIFLDIDFDERLDHIVKEYGPREKEKLMDGIVRIQKRLGGLETRNALKFLAENDVRECFRILLLYYDKQYLKGLNNRNSDANIITKVKCETVNSKENAQHLLQLFKDKK
jgi:tRNA 2-selenouridine synthase